MSSAIPMQSLPKNTLTSVYASMRDWTDSHKQTVAAFRQSLQEAIDFINTHDAETRAAIVKYTKQPARGRRRDPAARAAGDGSPRAGAVLHRSGPPSGVDQIEPRRREDDRAVTRRLAQLVIASEAEAIQSTRSPWIASFA